MRPPRSWLTTTAAEVRHPSTGNAITIASGSEGGLGHPPKNSRERARSNGHFGVIVTRLTSLRFCGTVSGGGRHGYRSVRTRTDGRKHGHAARTGRASRGRGEPEPRACAGGDDARRGRVELGRGHGEEDQAATRA